MGEQRDLVGEDSLVGEEDEEEYGSHPKTTRIDTCHCSSVWRIRLLALISISKENSSLYIGESKNIGRVNNLEHEFMSSFSREMTSLKSKEPTLNSSNHLHNTL